MFTRNPLPPTHTPSPHHRPCDLSFSTHPTSVLVSRPPEINLLLLPLTLLGDSCAHNKTSRREHGLFGAVGMMTSWKSLAAAIKTFHNDVSKNRLMIMHSTSMLVIQFDVIIYRPEVNCSPLVNSEKECCVVFCGVRGTWTCGMPEEKHGQFQTPPCVRLLLFWFV